MKQIIMFLIGCSFFLTSKAQDLAAYNADKLMKRASSNDTLYIINFWATWCAPCVHELPEFNKLVERYKGYPVKIILASLDFEEAYPKKIQNFVRKKKIQPEVVWFNETNPNEFIPKIDNSWQGSIPATLIIYQKHEYHSFFEGSITAQQIGLLVDKQLAYQD